jgi:hypothetical protein
MARWVVHATVESFEVSAPDKSTALRRALKHAPEHTIVTVVPVGTFPGASTFPGPTTNPG